MPAIIVLRNFLYSLFSLRIDHTKPLHYLPFFWWPIVIFVGTGLYLSLDFWCFCKPAISDYDLLFNQLKLPILIASFSVPISVTVARVHASKQAAKNLELANSSAVFNQYYDHRKHFFEHLDDISEAIEEGGYLTIHNRSRIYRYIFPTSSPTDPQWELSEKILTKHFETYAIKVLDEFEKSFEWLDSGDDKLHRALQRLVKPLGFKFSDGGIKTCTGYMRGRNLEATTKMLTGIIMDVTTKASEFAHQPHAQELLCDSYRKLFTHFIGSMEIKKWSVDGTSEFTKVLPDFSELKS